MLMGIPRSYSKILMAKRSVALKLSLVITRTNSLKRTVKVMSQSWLKKFCDRLLKKLQKLIKEPLIVVSFQQVSRKLLKSGLNLLSFPGRSCLNNFWPQQLKLAADGAGNVLIDGMGNCRRAS